MGVWMSPLYRLGDRLRRGIRGSDVYIYLMCLIDRVLGVYLSAVVLLSLRGGRGDEHLLTLHYFPWNAQHIIDREPKI